MILAGTGAQDAKGVRTHIHHAITALREFNGVQ